MIDRYRIEKDEDWHGWMDKIPFLSFPAGIEIKPIPAFAGAMVRFIARSKKSQNTVSVYFDVSNNLGYMDGPYWEIYPYEDDTARFMLGDEAEMIRHICKQLKVRPPKCE